MNNMDGITQLAIGLVVALVILGAVLVPIIENVGTNDEPEDVVVYNEGLTYKAVDDDTHTIIFKMVGNNDVVSVDGTDYVIKTVCADYLTDNEAIPLVLSENVGAVWGSGFSFSITGSDDVFPEFAPITITITNGNAVATWVDTDVGEDGFYDMGAVGWYISPDAEPVDGDRVMSRNAVVSEDTVMVGGWAMEDLTFYWRYAEGSLDAYVNPHYINVTSYSVPLTERSDGLYDVGDIAIVVEDSGSSSVYPLVPYAVSVPSEGGSDDSDNSVVKTLLRVVPILIAVALIMEIARYAFKPD